MTYSVSRFFFCTNYCMVKLYKYIPQILNLKTYNEVNFLRMCISAPSITLFTCKITFFP